MPRIFIADDNELIRKSLKTLLSEHRDWVVCGEAVNGRDAIDMARQLTPDLVLLDVAMPILNGLYACFEILKSMPTVPIVLYTLYKSDQMELEGKKAGARKVISKADDPNSLVCAVEELLSAASVLAPPLPLPVLRPPTDAVLRPDVIPETISAESPPPNLPKPPA